MNFRPLFLELFCMPRNESLRALHVSVGDVPDDLRHLMRREIDPNDRPCLCDVDMRRRVIERVDPYFESRFTNYRRHIISNALGLINTLVWRQRRSPDIAPISSIE
jgi:hypothetical protein